MKIKEIAAAILLVMLVWGSLAVGEKTAKLADNVSGDINRSLTLVQSGNFTDALHWANTALNTWESKRSYIQIFLNHKDAEMLSTALIDYIFAIKTESLAVVETSVYRLHEMIEELKKMESLQAESIL